MHGVINGKKEKKKNGFHQNLRKKGTKEVDGFKRKKKKRCQKKIQPIFFQ